MEEYETAFDQRAKTRESVEAFLAELGQKLLAQGKGFAVQNILKDSWGTDARSQESLRAAEALARMA